MTAQKMPKRTSGAKRQSATPIDPGLMEACRSLWYLVAHASAKWTAEELVEHEDDLRQCELFFSGGNDTKEAESDEQA